jgi:tetratricopeptide (TPR) repeat protein
MGLCYYLLGKTYRAQGELHKAISSYLECIPLKQHKFGANSLECAVIHNELGEAYGKVEDFDMAIESIVQALQIRKKELGNNSIEYGDSVFNLASEFRVFSFHFCPLNNSLSLRVLLSM